MKKSFLLLLTPILFFILVSRHPSILGTQTISLGYCPTMKPYALDYQQKNPKTNLLAFDSAALVLKALDEDRINLALVGRKAYPGEIGPDIKFLSQSNGFTLLSQKSQDLNYQDLSKLTIYTHEPDLAQVLHLFPADTNLKIIDKPSLSNLDSDKIYLFSWQDIDEDYHLATVYNPDASKTSQFRSPFIYSKQL